MPATLFILAGVLLSTSKCLGCSLPDFCVTNGNQLTLGPESIYTECDAEIPNSKVQSSPSVKIDTVNKDGKYLLIMVDPDAGSAAYVLHWMVSNIEGASLLTGRVQGTVLMSYEGPNPPDRQTHRYQYLLYEQSSRDVESASVRRITFDLDSFLSSNRLCDADVVASFQYKSYQG